MNPGAAGLASLVQKDDQELLELSDEQYHALWAGDWVDADPTLAPLMDILLTTLVAAQVADAGSGGEPSLVGPGAFVRRAHDRAKNAVVLREGNDWRCL